MENGTSLYPTTNKSLDSRKKRLEESKLICQENKDSLFSFLKKLQADGTSKQQQLSYLDRLVPITELLGNTKFKDATRQRMEGIFAEWRDKKDYKQASVNKAVECIKAFYRWLYGLTSQDTAPDTVKWMKKESQMNDIKPEELWTEEDVTKVLNQTNSDLLRILISVAYESGLRPGELRSLKIGDIKFNNDIVRVYCRGKMKRKSGDRVVPLLRNYEMLKKWVYKHPKKDNPNAWLWTYDDKPLPESTYRFQLYRLAKKANITKPLHPYILRHSALTRFYKEMQTPLAKELAGHAGNSEMIDVYCHLAISDLEDSVRKMNGIESKKTEKDLSICPKCNSIQDIGAMSCKACGERFSTKSACEIDEYEQNLIKLAKALLKRAEQRPEIVDLLLKG